MILRATQLSLIVIYAVLPIAFLAWAIVARYRWRRSAPLVSFCLACTAGVFVGIGLLLLNAFILGGRIPAGQSLKLLYFAIAAICLIKLVDHGLLRGAFRLARIRTTPLGQPVLSHHTRALWVLLAQRALLFALIIPYLAAVFLTYRPKVILSGNPKANLGLSFAPVQFITRDNLTLAGWWFPAARKTDAPDVDPDFPWGQHAVVLCHGIGSSKERGLILANYLVARGFNVLAFDFRGHGQSEGNFTSYGSRERYDVLAAVQWIKANHPEEARRIFGIGVNTGAAALVAAAADAQQGQLVDALVLYEPYARFQTLAAATSQRALPGVVRWLVNTIGLPLASLHAGADLAGFAPVDFAASIWPRPVLMIHGRGMSFIPVYEEMDLYHELTLPKQQFWPAENYAASRNRLQRTQGELSLITEAFRQWLGTSLNIADDPAIQDITYEFLRDARSLRAI